MSGGRERERKREKRKLRPDSRFCNRRGQVIKFWKKDDFRQKETFAFLFEWEEERGVKGAEGVRVRKRGCKCRSSGCDPFYLRFPTQRNALSLSRFPPHVSLSGVPLCLSLSLSLFFPFFLSLSFSHSFSRYHCPTRRASSLSRPSPTFTPRKCRPICSCSLTRARIRSRAANRATRAHVPGHMGGDTRRPMVGDRLPNRPRRYSIVISVLG